MAVAEEVGGRLERHLRAAVVRHRRDAVAAAVGDLEQLDAPERVVDVEGVDLRVADAAGVAGELGGRLKNDRLPRAVELGMRAVAVGGVRHPNGLVGDEVRPEDLPMGCGGPRPPEIRPVGVEGEDLAVSGGDGPALDRRAGVHPHEGGVVRVRVARVVGRLNVDGLRRNRAWGVRARGEVVAVEGQQREHEDLLVGVAVARVVLAADEGEAVGRPLLADGWLVIGPERDARRRLRLAVKRERRGRGEPGSEHEEEQAPDGPGPGHHGRSPSRKHAPGAEDSAILQLHTGPRFHWVMTA